MNKITKAVVALLVAGAATFATSGVVNATAPAAAPVANVQAVDTLTPTMIKLINGNNVHYCNWPSKVVVKFRTLSKGGILAYSPSGYYLGSKILSTPGTFTWYTPWEDIRYSLTGSIYSYSSWCG